MSSRYGLRSSRVVCVDEWDRVRVQPAKVIVEGSHILAVIPEGEGSASAEAQEMLQSCSFEDLGDAVIMPGIIDIYADLCLSEGGSWEGAESGTKAAVAGGVTTVVDLPTRYAHGPLPSTTGGVRAKAELIKKSKLFCDVGMWGVAGVESLKQIDGILTSGCWGFIAYMGFVSASIPSVSPSLFMNFAVELQNRTAFIGDEIPLLVNSTRMDFSQALRSSPCRNKTPEERLALKGPLNLQLSQGRASRASSANVSPGTGYPADPFPFDELTLSPGRRIDRMSGPLRQGSMTDAPPSPPPDFELVEYDDSDGDELPSAMTIRSHGISPKLNLCVDSKHMSNTAQQQNDVDLPPAITVTNARIHEHESQFHDAVVNGLNQLQISGSEHKLSPRSEWGNNERNNSIFSCPEELGEIYVDDDDGDDEYEEGMDELEVRPSVDPVWTAHADKYRHGKCLTLAVPERRQSMDANELQSPIVVEVGDIEEDEEDWRILQQLPDSEGETQSLLKTLPSDLIRRLHDAELQSYKFKPGATDEASAPLLQLPSKIGSGAKKCTSASSSPRRQSAPTNVTRPATGSRIVHHRPSYNADSRSNSASGNRVKKYSTLTAVDTLERLSLLNREREVADRWQHEVGHRVDMHTSPVLTDNGIPRPHLWRTSSRPPPIFTFKMNDERLTSQVICREYLIYLDGFSAFFELQGASIMLTYQHTQRNADPEIKTRALSAISAVSSKEMHRTDPKETLALDDEQRTSWARSIGNGSLVDDGDEMETGPQDWSLGAHNSPTDITSSSTEPYGPAPRRALELRSDADQSDLDYCEPANVHLHALALSSAAALGLFEEGEQSPLDADGSPRVSFASQVGIRLDEHLRVSYSITPYHLHFDSGMIANGATDFKVFPPLREPTDRMALHAALNHSTSAIVCSGHMPVPSVLKFHAEGDFFRAVAGTCSIQHVLPATWHFARNNGHEIEDVYQWLCRNPAELMGVYGIKGILRRHAQADIVVWDPEADVEVSNYQLLSQHPQTVFDGQILRGRVLRTYVRGQRVYESAVQPIGEDSKRNSMRNSTDSRPSVGFTEYSPPIFDHVFNEPVGKLITRDQV